MPEKTQVLVTKEAILQISSGSILICDPCRLPERYDREISGELERRSSLYSTPEMQEYVKRTEFWQRYQSAAEKDIPVDEEQRITHAAVLETFRNNPEYAHGLPLLDDYEKLAHERLGPLPVPPWLAQGEDAVYALVRADGPYRVHSTHDGLVIPLGKTTVDGKKVGEFFLDTSKIAIVDGSVTLEPQSPVVLKSDEYTLTLCESITCRIPVVVGAYSCKFGDDDHLYIKSV